MGILIMDSMGWPYDSFDCLSLNNHEAVCKKAPATPGLLMI